MSSWEDIADLVQLYQQFNEDPEKPIKPFEKKYIAYILFYTKKSKYVTYQIKKKKEGQFRNIEAPIGNLKMLQGVIKDCIELCFTPKKAAHGFVKKRSIVTNAEQHTKRRFVYNIDLENFFPSIHFGRVRGIFEGFPFNFPLEMAKHLANICCNDSVLPQGAPTSPIISNLICRNLDSRLIEFAKNNRIKYTRYADDITFSANQPIFENKDFLIELQQLIEKENFKINTSKVRLQSQAQRQVVTGLIVNRRVNVTPQYMKDLRFIIWLYVRNPEDARFWLERHYNKQHRYGGKIPAIEDVIRGKLDFLKMVIGEKSHRYTSVAEKFYEVLNPNVSNEKTFDASSKNISKVSNVKNPKNTNKDKKAPENANIEKGFEAQFEQFKNTTDEKEKGEILLKIKLEINQYKGESKLNTTILRIEKKFEKIISSENCKFLTHNLKNLNIQDPFRSVDEKIMKASVPIEGRNGISPENPQHLAGFLQLFRDKSHPFGSLIHEGNQYFGQVVYDVLKEFRSIGRRKGLFSSKIPYEIHQATDKFINNLNSSNNIEKYKERIYTDYFRENSQFLSGFRLCYRFHTSSEGVKISEIIKFEFLKATNNNSKIWYLDFDADLLDSVFEDVLTSTRNIGAAMGKIFRHFNEDKYSLVGAIKLRAYKKNNNVVLTITNIANKVNGKTGQDYLTRRGGDTKMIESLLQGYCHLNVVAQFSQERYSRIQLLPVSRKIESIENEPFEGFTYELVFPRPLEILLIDDGIDIGKRIEIAKRIIKAEPRLQLLLCAEESLHKSFDLDNFNAIFIHVGNREYQNNREHLQKMQIPLITFGGGITLFSKTTDFNLSMNQQQFYDNLEPYLRKVKEESDICFDFWESEIAKSENPKKDIYTLLDEIQRQKYQLNNLPSKIKENIYNLIGREVSLKQYFDLEELKNFINEERNKHESEYQHEY